MTSNTRWAAAFSVVAGLAVTTSANATWTFGGVDGGSATTSYSGSPSLTITGAYAANGGSLTSGATGTTIVSGNTYGISGFASAGTKWAVYSPATANTPAVNTKGALQFYSGGGLGMASDSTSGTVPNHALDNGPSTNSGNTINGLGNTESVLLSFSSSVVLSSIGLGYKFDDADISLFRYTGSSAPTLNGTGASLAEMQTAGWDLVGNYADLKVDKTDPYNTVNAGGKGSSWWLISAYNTAYGAATNIGTVDQGNDYFKVYAVAGTACTPVTSTLCGGGGSSVTSVPEPASLALASVSLMGLFGIRRRNNNKQA